MEEKRMVIIGVGAVLVIVTTSLLAVTLSSTDDETGDDGGEPELQVNRTNPLLLISLDGFKSNYIYRDLPTLETLAMNGVWASFMMPSYPTLTFPNHYSIVTGMYPEAHGIVANNFYDPVLGKNFSMGVKDGALWGGEPIWNTLTLQNKTSATYFWPGSDCNISGLYPTQYFAYDKSTPFINRVDQVIEWLSQPEEERPDFISLYFEEPDSTGHHDGPESLSVDQQLKDMDGLIGYLLASLRAKELENKVNIIVLADHGMAMSGMVGVLNLTDYVPDIASLASHAYYGAFTTLRLENSSEAAVESILKSLACPEEAPSMRAYTPRDLPKRFHYSNNKRIGDIVLDLDSGFFTYNRDYPEGNEYLGNHGYDNHLSSMGALFIATGPDFKKGVRLEPFQNIEVYNLMCYLTGVEPAPNNGTEGALYAALLNPPPLSELPVEDELPEATFPDSPLINDTLHMANCAGDLNEEDDVTWLDEINLNTDERQQLEELHFPWGIPSSGNVSENILLHHKDHITGYSQLLKMPLWTSFTVLEPVGLEGNSSFWSSDVRLSPSTTPTCDSYDGLTVEGSNVEMFPLFHPKFSIDPFTPEIPYLVSNAVPLVVPGKTVEAIAFLIDTWKLNSASLNLVIGLAFDYDADSLPDDTTNATIPAVPSHIYIVATRCRQLVNNLSECQHTDLDAQSFIFPQFQTANNHCLTRMKYGSFHLATLRDIELLTGLTFFPELDPEVHMQLALRIHTKMWA